MIRDRPGRAAAPSTTFELQGDAADAIVDYRFRNGLIDIGLSLRSLWLETWHWCRSVARTTRPTCCSGSRPEPQISIEATSSPP